MKAIARGKRWAVVGSGANVRAVELIAKARVNYTIKEGDGSERVEHERFLLGRYWNQGQAEMCARRLSLVWREYVQKLAAWREAQDALDVAYVKLIAQREDDVSRALVFSELSDATVAATVPVAP